MPKHNKKLLNKSLRLRADIAQPEKQVTFPEAMMGAGKAFEAGQYILAEFLLEQIVEQLPKAFEACLILLRLYINKNALDKAQPLLQKCKKIDANDIELLRLESEMSERLGDIKHAADILERLIKRKPKNASLYHQAALLQNALGSREGVIRYIDTAISIKPKEAEYHYFRALQFKGSGDNQSIESINHLLQGHEYTTEDEGKLHFALYWLTDMSRVDEKFAYLRKANELISKVRPYELAKDELKHEKIRDWIDKIAINVTPNSSCDSAPIFIAGMPRSGTTLLEQILGAHTMLSACGESLVVGRAIYDIAVTHHKSLSYYEWSDVDLVSGFVKQIADTYSSHPVIAQAGGLGVVDKSIDSFENLGLIQLAFPNARFIYVQRNPMDMCWSCYESFFPTGYHYIYDLDACISQHKLFHSLMSFWMEQYPDKILKINYEDLVVNAEQEICRVLNFCGLEYQSGCLNFYTADTSVRTTSAMQVRRPVNSDAIARWMPYKAHVADLMSTSLDK